MTKCSSVARFRWKVVFGCCALAPMFVGTLGACAMDSAHAVAITTPIMTAVQSTPDEVHAPHAGMLRYPDVGRTHIVFAYANDLWLVPIEGGTAIPLASPEGVEAFPRFSPDDKTIAFVGNYDGDEDLYTMPVGGGIPRRVTHHPATEILCDWTPDGKLLFFSNALAGLPRQTQLFTVPVTGGIPTRLPVPYGANGAISPDGTWLAYTPHTRDSRTWKRYEGGMATDIWLFNLRDNSAKKITDWEGTDSQPMWHGDMVYYMSDEGPDHRLNIWSYDTKSGKHEQITRMKEFDVKWPSIGAGPNGTGEIVFQNGPDLMLLDLATKQVRTVPVNIPGARPKVRPHLVDASENIQDREISATGKRVVLSARGDIWTLPAKHGSPRNLTATSGVAERDPYWSPDGRWISYFSDESGEYHLYIMQSDGKGKPRKLTDDGEGYLYTPRWSPDSKRIVFRDKTGSIYVTEVESGDTKLVDRDEWAAQGEVNWSSDSNWLVYAKTGDNVQRSLWLYKVDDGTKHQVTSGMFNDEQPVFGRDGKFLYFVSNREFSSPVYEDIGTTFVYNRTGRLYAVPLRDDIASPWAPKSDEETWKDEKEAEKKKDEDSESNGDEDAADKKDEDEGAGEKKNDEDHAEKGDKKQESQADEEEGEESAEKDGKHKGKKKEPVKIDLEGFEHRVIQVPVDRGNFAGLAVNDKGQLIYVRVPRRGEPGEPSIKLLDPKDEKKKEKTVLDGARAVAMSPDGKKLLVMKHRQMAIVNTRPKQKMEDQVSTKGMLVQIDPRAEWRQIFNEAWRIERDFFYDPNMHGVDWPAIRDQYAKMLDDCNSREDVRYVIGEMIAELNVGHAYARGGGDGDEPEHVSVGMLGCDFALENGAFRIKKIYEGGVWDIDARGPLSQPDVGVKEGDYVLAVNGTPMDTTSDPWAAFQGMAGETVTITVSDKPTMDDDARDVVVKLLPSEREERFRNWIESKREYVDEKSDGKVGYIYVTNTGINGQNDLFRQFYGQRDKAALIVDDRWNGGGQIPTRFVELLNRPVANYWARRDGHDWTWPPDSQQGPKCMLINGMAGSGGDYFPWWFRAAGVGPLIGMRTWGGLVGYSGGPRFIDGATVTSPSFAFYEKNGTWGIEGHGVDPDYKVVDDPSLMVNGDDPQLDKAIELMLDDIQKNPYTPPARPAYPDRSGMGIKPEDK